MNNIDKDKALYIIDEQHPYPGLFPFRYQDKNYFFGRDREIQELTQLIEYNVLTVIFGKSGMGKTSLLQAGLIPWIQENYYLPIYIRIDFNNPAFPPIRQVKDTIQLEIRKIDIKAPTIEDKTLWEYFSFTKILNGVVTPLLIFDQFEEIFTAPGKSSPEVDNFVTEITDLIENQAPETVREQYQKEGKALTFPGQELNIRVIFSLREEYLPQLETLSYYLPSVKLSRYRISYMKGDDAVKAVLQPARKIISEIVAVEIIKKIPTARDADYNPYEYDAEQWESRKIEPFLLSLFCYRINEKRLENKEEDISLELIRDINAEEIIGDHYEKNMADMPAQVKNAVEDYLLTPDGHRKLQEMNSLREFADQVTEKHIEELVKRRILRIEPRSGIDYVELIHDVLTPVLKESRDKRKVGEAAQKKKRKWIFIATFTLLVLAVLVIFISNNQVQQAKIKMEKENALKEAKRAEQEKQKRLAYEWAAYSIDLQKRDRDLSFRLAEQACKQEKDDPVSRRALLSVFYEGGFYQELLGNKDSEFSQTKSEKSDFFAEFSPDGKKILTVTSEKAMLWNWDGQKIEKDRECSLQGDIEFRPNASFSPDGNVIVFCTKAGNRAVIWNIGTNQLKPLTFEWEINSVAFSPNKSNIAFIAACRDNNIREFDLSGKLKKTFAGHSGEVISAFFSKDGQYVISTAWDNTVRIWDLNGKTEVTKAWNDSNGGIRVAAFSPVEKEPRVVTGSADGTVQWWNFNLTKAQSLGKQEGAVTSAVLSPDGQYILTGGDEGTVRLLTLNNFMVIEFKDWPDAIRAATFSPDGKYILIGPAEGPAELRPIDPVLIVKIVNQKGKVHDLTDDNRLTYNLARSTLH